jgi:hypothetical protein
VADAAAVRVRPATATDEERWTAFVGAQADATLYQTLAWRDVVRRVFGHEPLYLLAERGGALSGVFPAFEVRFPVLGRKLISMPYDLGSGGPLATDEETESALAGAALDLARGRGALWLECRTGVARPALERAGMRRAEPVILSEIRLEEGRDPWQAVSNDQRQSVRRAAKRGITIREAATAADFDAFYRVYLRSFRDFGTPPYGRGYFPALRDMLLGAGHLHLLLAELEGRCVGGMLLFHWRRTLVNKIGCVLPEAVSLRAFAALYAHALDLAARLGIRRFSLGTSSRAQSGLVEFKERWGAVSAPAVVYQAAVRREPPSLERYFSEDGLAQRAWRRLPVGATPLLGGVLNRWFC